VKIHSGENYSFGMEKVGEKNNKKYVNEGKNPLTSPTVIVVGGIFFF
jgi:hypothetical protein